MRLDAVTVRYGRRGPRVLDGVTLDLAPGTVTAVVGGNGSGKSTLLKVAAGLLRPVSGGVTGRPRRVGYVPERLPATTRLAARPYLAHMGRVQGLSTEAAARRGRELLDRLAVEGDLDAPIGTLSKGNAQKIALAQALLSDPGLLILDEPWSGLDARAHRTLADCFAEWRAAGVVVLLTEHRPGTVEGTADAVHRLDGGRLTVRAPGERPPAGVAVTLGAAAADPAGAARTLAAIPGVLSVRRDGTRLRLDVAVGRSDAVLAEALAGGLTVVEVRPVPGGRA
ncbi:ABC transporter ATP-binding protein [Streptomyces sp. RFCAC02]|uniref:ATP-binding cassette domain-containing protein n=1 Tax=Streptomyces sp. RFCAC02 TaxID=2499143 RepID=UPI001021DCE6|nr:ABC transporter ATP-binding protein [Streptomyces sp. RFCAC02]